MERAFSDTSPETEHVLFAMLRDMPAWRKLDLVAQLNQTVREPELLSGLRERYPQADEAEIWRRLADLVLGSELAEKAYGPLFAESNAEIDMDEIVLSVEAAARVELLEKALSESGS